jgi:hypothetical protein
MKEGQEAEESRNFHRCRLPSTQPSMEGDRNFWSVAGAVNAKGSRGIPEAGIVLPRLRAKRNPSPVGRACACGDKPWSASNDDPKKRILVWDAARGYLWLVGSSITLSNGQMAQTFFEILEKSGASVEPVCDSGPR